MDIPPDEIRAIRERYGRRKVDGDDRLYDPFAPYVVWSRQERERALVRLLREEVPGPVADGRVLEVGCGRGANLVELIRLGFRPGNLVGNDLLSERLDDARGRLPAGVRLVAGDASALDLGDGSYDIVLQSTVFTSILDDRFQSALAARMWAMAASGGGVLWYDFVYDNPHNPDVRGVPVRRVRELFPRGRLRCLRVTLAPPIGRRLGRFTPALYPLLNAISLFRTHVLCWVGKPA